MCTPVDQANLSYPHITPSVTAEIQITPINCTHYSVTKYKLHTVVPNSIWIKKTDLKCLTITALDTENQTN